MFVALWHDLNAKWIAFGVLNASGMALETIVFLAVSASPKLHNALVSSNNVFAKALVVIAGGLNLCFLILANFSINHGFRVRSVPEVVSTTINAMQHYNNAPSNPHLLSPYSSRRN
jgi:hypothetical protein